MSDARQRQASRWTRQKAAEEVCMAQSAVFEVQEAQLSVCTLTPFWGESITVRFVTSPRHGPDDTVVLVQLQLPTLEPSLQLSVRPVDIRSVAVPQEEPEGELTFDGGVARPGRYRFEYRIGKQQRLGGHSPAFEVQMPQITSGRLAQGQLERNSQWWSQQLSVRVVTSDFRSGHDLLALCRCGDPFIAKDASGPYISYRYVGRQSAATLHFPASSQQPAARSEQPLWLWRARAGVRHHR